LSRTAVLANGSREIRTRQVRQIIKREKGEPGQLRSEFSNTENKKSEKKEKGGDKSMGKIRAEKKKNARRTAIYKELQRLV